MYFRAGDKFLGGQEVTVPVTINDIPVFVKGGSFIPMVKAFNNMEEYRIDSFIIKANRKKELFNWS